MAFDSDASSKRICKLIYEVRRARSITQNDLARRLAISQPHLSKIENELAVPSLVQWLQFCQAFAVPTDIVLDESEYKAFLMQIRLGDLASEKSASKKRAS